MNGYNTGTLRPLLHIETTHSSWTSLKGLWKSTIEIETCARNVQILPQRKEGRKEDLLSLAASKADRME